MTSKPLHNYLRTYRRRSAYSQKDIAFLMQFSSVAVCRHETSTKSPKLATALAYEAIFETRLSELFAGVSEAVRAELRSRAILLLAATSERPTSSRARRRVEQLKRLAADGEKCEASQCAY
jgi:DNA-binding XRE family transcriptional regulator